MSTWHVKIPLAGHVIREVEADSEKEAIKLAMEMLLDIDSEEIELDVYEHLVQGNVCNAPYSSVEAEEQEEDKDE